jgi:hypothetical protein
VGANSTGNNDVERTDKYEKSPDYEALLEDFNRRVADLEAPDRDHPRYPVTFIVGTPRAGTTLLYQALAASGAFGYPSNVAARFFRAPWAGARVQQILEPVLEHGQFTYSSNAGLTDPWYEPHEFGYFWERHFDFEDHHELEGAQAEVSGAWEFRRELGAFEKELGGPLLFKNVILDYVLEVLDRWLPEVHFIHMRRDPMLVAQSLYRTRIDYYGQPEAWFSVRPREADEVDDAPPARQIAVQIRSVLESVEQARETVDDDRWTELTYRELCDDPRGIVSGIGRQWGDAERLTLEELPEEFSASTELVLDDEILSAFERELDRQGIATS